MIADAILLFKAQRGCEYVYEISDHIFSNGKKPPFVFGVDKTDELVKWIDSDAAKAAGI